ncbi:MAG: alginate export family protein, partial [Verrucomicrobiota bacterium]
PLKDLTLTADYHAFWLANTSDLFYQASGASRSTGGYGIKANAGSYVGSEVDLIASYNVCKAANMQAGYGHFFVGDYIKNSLSKTSGATDADWVYLQMTVNF